MRENEGKTRMLEATFRLKDNFVARYKNVKPPFGFNGLGELVYMRTYSRIKEDGTNEEWYETVRRVVEGTYRMQERHISANDLGWNDARAQKSAQEMYDRIFSMKFLPPGRGLWAMGSPITEERGLFAALNNCFAYETEIITSEGIKRIGDLSNTEVVVLSTNGEWVTAPIRSFGEQDLMKITLRRQGTEKTIYATPEHRWFAKSQSEVNHSKGYAEYFTQDLKPGFRLQYIFGQGIKDVRPSPFGIAHGIAFGDATTASNPHLYLCGDKDRELAKWFPLNHITEDTTKNAFRVADLPKYFKKIPDINESKSYLHGWLAGYFAADGSCQANGQCGIDSYDRKDIEFVRDVCAKIGIGTWNIRTEIRTSNLTGESCTCYSIGLMREHLTKDFFLLSSHRDNFMMLDDMKKQTFWNVVSVEKTDRHEEVFCATVEGKGAFALADNILTGNCAFVTTEKIDREFEKPFTFLMDASMLGVGVGFDTKGAEKIVIRKPEGIEYYQIPDTREGWVTAVGKTLRAFFVGEPLADLDYSLVRPFGVPIKGFGGISSGPEPLKILVSSIKSLLFDNVGKPLTSTMIVDIQNLIGKCVVAGNVRRTAEIAFGEWNDLEYLDLKDYTVNPHRSEYGWTSNNSIFAEIGMDYEISASRVARNGEPGYAWLDNMQKYSRMNGVIDNKDSRVKGGNPCLEQSLESMELCCLVESFPSNHDNLDDYLRTLKFAYLYAKTVTLGKTHWPETNRVMLRNRRIGCSMSGIQQFVARNGLDTLKDWCEAGYEKIEYYDRKYSEWFAIPQSIKKTSIKPSGTVSLLAGATPGMHWPESRHYIRRMRLAIQSDLVQPLLDAGYFIEASVDDPKNTLVVEVPVSEAEPRLRITSEVSMWEQLSMAAFLQKYWADNQVSCTVTFDPEREGGDIANALNYYQYNLKGISFLPRAGNDLYPQLPYEAITEETYVSRAADIKPLVFLNISAEKADVEKFCDGGKCVLPTH